jgi:hypothetical protein
MLSMVSYHLLTTLDEAPPGLIAEVGGVQAGHRVEVAARCLRASLTDWLYLECRLDRPPPARTDLIVRVDRRGRHVLAREMPSGLGPADGEVARAWAGVRAVARRWIERRSPWTAAVVGLWLELDLVPDQTDPPLPAPRLFFDFDRKARSRQQTDRNPDSILRPLRSLLGGSPPPGVRAALERCLRLLPPGAVISSVGVADIERWAGLRLCLTGLAGDGLGPFLKQIGWSGDGDAAAVWHRALAGQVDRSVEGVSLLHLDLSEVIGPRIGLEYTLGDGAAPGARFPQDPLFDALAERGLCDARMRATLGRWPGHGVRVLSHQLWPSLLIRRINHIKVVQDPSGVIESKAYLSFCHRPHRRGQRVAPRLYR